MDNDHWVVVTEAMMRSQRAILERQEDVAAQLRLLTGMVTGMCFSLAALVVIFGLWG